MWAATARKEQFPPPPPTPEERLQALTSFYSRKSGKTILLEALGANHGPMPGTPVEGTPLVPHMVAICIDAESWTANTDLMTELGINVFSRQKGRQVTATIGPGPHGINLMRTLEFYHFRIAESAHLLSNREGSYGPLGNRFGKTRFITYKELRVVLEHFFNQDIISDDPTLQGCKRPVILVGHALRHDLENVNKEGLEYDFTKYSTIVAQVDTQPLARETGVWVPPEGMKTNEIGLRVLVEEKIGFLHLDDHTASNDAARTMMCGIWMCLPAGFTQVRSPDMQMVANAVEKHSNLSSAAPYGTVELCIRCGGRDHSKKACTATVKCAACDRFDRGSNRDQNVASHIETYCQDVAVFKAWARRYKDAWLKNRLNGRSFSAEILAGCGPDAHPYSTWMKLQRPYWPLKHLDEVLEGMGMSAPPPAFVYNLPSALGGLAVPPAGDWVQPPPNSAVANGTVPSSAPPVRPALPAAFGPLTLVPAPASAPTPLPAPAPAPAPAFPATHVVTMSASRARGGRNGPRDTVPGGQGGSGRGDGGFGGVATSRAPRGPVWDAWND